MQEVKRSTFEEAHQQIVKAQKKLDELEAVIKDEPEATKIIIQVDGGLSLENMPKKDSFIRPIISGIIIILAALLLAYSELTLLAYNRTGTHSLCLMFNRFQ
jgi:hypothetical protein